MEACTGSYLSKGEAAFCAARGPVVWLPRQMCLCVVTWEVPSPLGFLRSQAQHGPPFLTSGKLWWWLSTALGTAVLPSAGDSPSLSFHPAKHTRGCGRRQLCGAGKVEGGEGSPLGPSTSQYSGVEGGRPATDLPTPEAHCGPRAGCIAFLCVIDLHPPKLENGGANICFCSFMPTRPLFPLSLINCLFSIHCDFFWKSLFLKDFEVRKYHTYVEQVGQGEPDTMWFHLYVKSNKQNKWTKNKLIDKENKLMIAWWKEGGKDGWKGEGIKYTLTAMK